MKNSGLYIALCFLVLVVSCKQDPPVNPYDALIYDEDVFDSISLDPNSFPGIHKNILQTKCAMPACHDGAFEPDFRTAQSAYATLVYHSTIKDLPNKDFEFRVQPGDTAESWLWERITTDNDTIGQMPLYAPELSAAELENISNWILNGAKDMFGENPRYPNKEPLIQYFVALSDDYQINYSDNRVNDVGFNPFYAPKDSTMLVIAFVEDDSTALHELQVNQLKISASKDNFSAAQTFNANYVDLGQNGQYWISSVPTQGFNQAQVYYMQYHVNDGDHVNNTYFPLETSIDPYKTYWSFIIP